MGNGFDLNGIPFIHIYFLLETPTASLLAVEQGMLNNITKLCCYVCPADNGSSDPRVNLVKDPNLAKLGCQRVMIDQAVSFINVKNLAS